jgi:hypothetical protein
MKLGGRIALSVAHCGIACAVVFPMQEKLDDTP